MLKFKMLVRQALHGLSLAQTSYTVRDRLSWMRFCGLGPGDTKPEGRRRVIRFRFICPSFLKAGP